MNKKVVYIAGRITGEPNYKEKFEAVARQVEALGFAVLNPAVLPAELGSDRAMKICTAMIDQADAVYFAPGWSRSVGAQLEMAYSKYTGKPHATKLESLEVLL